MIKANATSCSISILIAGDIDHARRLCQEYCDDVGFCVTVTPTVYVYRGGQEDGIIVGLINYPRFPMPGRVIEEHATKLAQLLRVGLGQDSFSIQGPDQTVWYSWRDEK